MSRAAPSTRRTPRSSRCSRRRRSCGGRARPARTIHLGTSVTAIDRDAGGEVTGVRTDAADEPAIGAPFVINAAGTWAGEVAALAGAPIPVLPRRGFILVTEPLPRVVRHKVYTADYVANVASSDAGLETSAVVEGTRGGHGADRRQPGARRLRPDGQPAGRPAARGAGRRAVPVPRGRRAAADVPRVPALLPGPPAGHRRRTRARRACPRVRPRGRGHRAGRRDRPSCSPSS